MAQNIRAAVGEVDDIRRIYLEPNITDDYDLTPREPDLKGIVDFLCTEREFSNERVAAAIDRAFRERSFW